jgi:hypothetical protein
MDATEITNNEYRQFVYWVRDSIAARQTGGNYVKDDKDGNQYINWEAAKKIKYSDPKIIEDLAATDFILPPDDRLYGKKEIDPSKMIYQVERLDLKQQLKERMQVSPAVNLLRNFL